MIKTKYYVNRTALVEVVNNWLAKGHLYHWAGTPQELLERIERASISDEIEYHTLTSILESMETTKMIGTANKGLVYFREWAKANKVCL